MLRITALLLVMLCLTGCHKQESVPASFIASELQPGIYHFVFDPGTPSQMPSDTLFVSHLNQWLEQNPTQSVTKITPLQRQTYNNNSTRITSYLVITTPKKEK